MDTFAKKLAAGLISVPARLSWWPRHSRMMVRLLCVGNETPNSQENIKQMMGMSAAEWEAAIPIVARKNLMGHHSLLEMGLIDAAKKKNHVEIDKIGALLKENAEEMAASFGKCVVEFPESRFFRLLLEHVSSFAEMVRLNMEGSLKRSGDKLERNTLALAAFTTEWF